ncbi:hypothetical protein, partial [uncultured Endozoicomonas sp.]|uniref:hypothetical protein n=1 Tax=uncultured Endozoicomonas sp. TaxID=432652 RepID=UPI002628B7E5
MTPLPSLNNTVSSVLDNAPGETGVSGRQELPAQSPALQEKMDRYHDTMKYFDKAHRDALRKWFDTMKSFDQANYDVLSREMFDSKEYLLEILEAAKKLLETCKNRSIMVKSTLFSMLKFHDINKHHSDLETFYEKCNVFFTALNTDVSRDTACLTSMLNKSTSSNIKIVSDGFLSKADDEVQYIAQSPFLKNISSMCNGQGLPEKTKVEAFLKLPCLKEGWQAGKDEDVKDKPLDRAL